MQPWLLWKEVTQNQMMSFDSLAQLKDKVCGLSKEKLKELLFT